MENMMDKDVPMWNYLSGLDNYTESLPIYVESPFSESQISALKEIIDDKLAVSANYYLVPGGQEEYRGQNWHDPKKVVHMSREMVEFDAPSDIEQTMDKHVKHLYPEEIKLCHYSYIDYDLRHGEGRYAPSLPPHIDNTETIVTFNYMLDGNIDWDIYIDNKPYSLKTGDAILFSAINQVHWRPKRSWKEGEFVKILTFDYSPLSDWRFTGESYPLDPVLYQDRVQKYLDKLHEFPQIQEAWNLYNKLGLENNIPVDKHGLIG